MKLFDSETIRGYPSLMPWSSAIRFACFIAPAVVLSKASASGDVCSSNWIGTQSKVGDDSSRCLLQTKSPLSTMPVVLDQPPATPSSGSTFPGAPLMQLPVVVHTALAESGSPEVAPAASRPALEEQANSGMGPPLEVPKGSRVEIPVVVHDEAEVRARHWAAQAAATANRVMEPALDSFGGPAAVVPPASAFATPVASQPATTNADFQPTAEGTGASQPATAKADLQPTAEGTAEAQPVPASTSSHEGKKLAWNEPSEEGRRKSSGPRSQRGKHHHSIFQLPFETLDDPAFWGIWSILVFFTIIVDLCENYAHEKAKYSKTEQMFLQRINSELMMFGCVGLGLFVASNFWVDMPQHYYLLFEFVDILCSMGALGLMFSAVLLYTMRHRAERIWKAYETTDPVDPVLTRALDMSPSYSRSLNLQNLKYAGQRFDHEEHHEFQLMARVFRQNHRLPDTFDYAEYLTHCLSMTVCELVEIKWHVWMLLLMINGIGFLIAHLYEGTLPPLYYVMIISSLHWVVFIAHVYVFVSTRDAHNRLFDMFEPHHLNLIRPSSDSIKNPGMPMYGGNKADITAVPPEDECPAESPPPLMRQISGSQKRHQLALEVKPEVVHEHPMGPKWGENMKWFIQIISLANSFLGAFYFMHMVFNIRANGFSRCWHLVLIVPLLLNTVMLTSFAKKVTLVQAYLQPDDEAMDSVLDSVMLNHEDLAFLRQIWIARGRPPLTHFKDEGVDEDGLGFVMRGLGVYIGRIRLRRLFVALDKNKDGIVDLQEFMAALHCDEEEEAAAAAASLTPSP